MYMKFLAVVSEISKVPVENIDQNTSFRDDLGIDSLQLVNLLVNLSEQFNVEISSIQSIEDVQTVGKMYTRLIQTGDAP